MTKIGVLGAGRDNKHVEWDTMTFGNHFASIHVDAGDVGKDHIHILVVADNAANW